MRLDPRLEPALTLPEHWKEMHDAEPPNENAIANASRALVILDELGFPPDRIEPDVDSGIEFKWRRVLPQNKTYRAATVSFMNERCEGDLTDCVALLTNGSGKWTPCWYVDPENLREELERIQRFIVDGIWEGTE